MAKPLLEKSRPPISIIDFDRADLITMLRQRLAGKGIVNAFLIGSLAKGTQRAWSDIDLILVRDSQLPFIERPREFLETLADLALPLDILVYTPAEFLQLEEDPSGFWREIRASRLKII